MNNYLMKRYTPFMVDTLIICVYSPIFVGPLDLEILRVILGSLEQNLGIVKPSDDSFKQGRNRNHDGFFIKTHPHILNNWDKGNILAFPKTKLNESDVRPILDDFAHKKLTRYTHDENYCWNIFKLLWYTSKATWSAYLYSM